MTAVKGSKQYKLEVVPYRPVWRWTIRLTFVALAAIAVAVAHWYATKEALRFQQAALQERDQFERALADSRAEVERLQQEVANLRLGSEVDKVASEDVRNEVIDLKAQIAELQEDISFYRGLMAPNAEAQGLTIGSLNLLSTGVDRHYRYKLVVQQFATNHKLLTGSLNFTIVGRQNDLPMSLALKDVSATVDAMDIRLGFKYFQNIEGEMVLPQGFEPIRIEISARVRGAKPATVEKKFGWLVEER
ncbi:DUF6776 family protein [Simiduia agarivorans]|uniref:Uncharacterized protein n=1 Tax=Simiduia agarivorans (strain DSM 21679 / JCM 13881 / BCRC 17597 / SA1) TaxID=1117647 RepID=K4KLH2_SIMAS|nr:DUF6776 family protein [Simiduia agarivorans]AFU99070.1 hypothetical protein M5M_09425 [Simiduia agarivorans SA1 = DSM 21679]